MMNIWPQHSTEIQERQSFHQCTYFDPTFHVTLAVLSLQSQLMHTTFYIWLHALKHFTAKPTLQPTQWCTHTGNMMTTLHLILHTDKCVIVRSHIRNDRLLIWAGLVHIWNRRLQYSLFLCDITIIGAQLILFILYQKRELSTSCSVMYKVTISGGMYLELCLIHTHSCRR